MSGRGGGALSGGCASGGGAGGGGGPCGACKFLRRKCVSGCIFAPYFGSEQGAANFSAVHKVFGASNVSKLLMHIPANKRLDAVVTICYEAQARLRDPVHGCVSHIFALQQQVVSLQAELSLLRAHLATLELTSPPPPPPPPPSSPLTIPISELPPASSLPPSFDLATLFETPVNLPWSVQQQQQDRQVNRRQFAPIEDPSGGGDLRSLARELVEGQKSAATLPPPAVSK
ncbi:unnamed protein product [Spirodela intermedia]|uniref:LOB domain-containing protein n=1 Tax=Spirodela intermedia TaxID=51605 RepID=A0A7I8K3Y6_SPIIN|nr:unnamed protein product [Spirodela intermedia]